MFETYPRSSARIFGHPIHPMIVPFPIVFFVSAFAADLLGLRTGEPGWATASNWLLGAGLATAALAALLGFTDFIGDRRIRGLSAAWLHMIANILAVLVEAANLGLRLTAGVEADIVGSIGVYLSGGAVLLLLFSGWMGGELVFRHGVGRIDDRGASIQR
jgi:uncharacterized membrane protein